MSQYKSCICHRFGAHTAFLFKTVPAEPEPPEAAMPATAATAARDLETGCGNAEIRFFPGLWRAAGHGCGAYARSGAAYAGRYTGGQAIQAIHAGAA